MERNFPLKNLLLHLFIYLFIVQEQWDLSFNFSLPIDLLFQFFPPNW